MQIDYDFWTCYLKKAVMAHLVQGAQVVAETGATRSLRRIRTSPK
jgi:hypothetical protein